MHLQPMLQLIFTFYIGIINKYYLSNCTIHKNAVHPICSDVRRFYVGGLGIAIPEVLVERLQDVRSTWFILFRDKGFAFLFHVLPALRKPPPIGLALMCGGIL